MAGQFADFEDEPELYESNENSTFDCEDGSKLTCEKQSDGGYVWVEIYPPY